MRPYRRLFRSVLFSLLVSTPVLAQPLLILGNLPGTPSGTGTNLGLGIDSAVRLKAVGFTTGADPLRLLSATALVSNPAPASVLSAAIHADDAGNPGAQLFALEPVPVPENTPATELALSPPPGGIELDAGTSYWLVFSGPATTQSLLWESLDPNTAPVADGVAYLGYRFSSTGGASWAASTTFNGVSVLAEPAGPATELRLAMPDSTNNRMVLFDPETGALVDDDWFPLQGGTPIHVVQVGDELWVSEQIGDRIARFDLDGTFLGQIGGGTGGGLDNLRGMAIVGDEVWLSNAGTANGAPGRPWCGSARPARCSARSAPPRPVPARSPSWSAGTTSWSPAAMPTTTSTATMTPVPAWAPSTTRPR